MFGIFGLAGVRISQGPADWQIIQQVNGSADIALEGVYKTRGVSEDTVVKVMARIMHEASGETVVPWQEAELLPVGGAPAGMGVTNDGNASARSTTSVDAAAAAADAFDVNSPIPQYLQGTPTGSWRIVLAGIPAGGLYRIETTLIAPDREVILEATKGDMIHHVGVGDIFLISGQSNAAGRARDPVTDPVEIGVHMYRSNGNWALAAHPLNESTSSLYPVHVENHNPGHSPYLMFAKLLKRELGYPIGLVQSSCGGMPLSYWDTDEQGDLFHNMIRIVRDASGGKVAGVLWYQGCADAFESRGDDYLERFELFVSRTREELGLPELPFLTVQLSRCTRESDPAMDSSWGKVREAQRRAALDIPGVYVVPSTDMMLYDFIHISAAGNLVLGERLAKTALSVLYGRPKPWQAPDLERASLRDDGRVELRFRNVLYNFHLFYLPQDGIPFTLMDEEGDNPVRSFDTWGSCIVLEPGRPVNGSCVVHGAWQMNPKGPTPADWGRLPMLSFYGVSVQP